MNTYGTLNEFLSSFPTGPPDGITFEIQTAFLKAWPMIHGSQSGPGLYTSILVGISGGSDSDLVLDMIERIGHPASAVRYVFYDSKMEFQATKRHMDYLENRYGIRIERLDAKVPVPLGVRRYGVPFMNKKSSNYIARLQKHGFDWSDKPLEQLLQKYPNCQSALRWWCNAWGEKSLCNIGRHRWLKEFMAENPPDFPISDTCCTGAKKATANTIEKAASPDLSVLGLRRAEGGARATAYRTCFDDVCGGPDRYRPVFWFRKRDKEAYERIFGIVHSDCYTVYGLKRTGCACCPFGRDFETELTAAKQYEPGLYNAAIHVFGDSYRYTRAYRAYARDRDARAGKF